MPVTRRDDELKGLLIKLHPTKVCPIAVDYYNFPSVDVPIAACSSHSHRPYPGFAVLVLRRIVVVRYTLLVSSQPTSLILISVFSSLHELIRFYSPECLPEGDTQKPFL